MVKLGYYKNSEKNVLEDVLYINFENAGSIADLFEENIDPKRIIEYLSAYHQQKNRTTKNINNF